MPVRVNPGLRLLIDVQVSQLHANNWVNQSHRGVFWGSTRITLHLRKASHAQSGRNAFTRKSRTPSEKYRRSARPQWTKVHTRECHCQQSWSRGKGCCPHRCRNDRDSEGLVAPNILRSVATAPNYWYPTAVTKLQKGWVLGALRFSIACCSFNCSTLPPSQIISIKLLIFIQI